MSNQDQSPWLVAVWPGMGNVALLLGVHLVEELEVAEVAALDPSGHFDIASVEVHNGVVSTPRYPFSTLYRWQNPAGRDLLIMVGEDQPAANGYAFCQKILTEAARYEVSRVFTFAASMAGLEPHDVPGLSGVVTHRALLPVLREHDIPLMEQGRISGLNGVFLGAAAARGLEGMCLLGEVPFYAIQFPNPATSLALLRMFGRMAGIEVPLERLEGRVESVRPKLEALYRAVREAAEAQDQQLSPTEEVEEMEAGPPPQALERIDELFREAAADRSKALELKEELDRWDLFPEYEDRFLDLFKSDSS